MKIPLYIIGGFLGSGKTSLINSILSYYKGQSVGLIINEFGSLGIDGKTTEADESVLLTELNGGQIFCSCLSGSFVETISSYRNKNIRALFVEASGLAKPSPLKEIISFAEKKSDNAFDYRGMLCVVDAERFELLSQSLKTLAEQIEYSDRVILNKTDLVNEADLNKVRERLELIKPGTEIFCTSYGRINSVFLKDIQREKNEIPDNVKKWQGWGEAGRPRSVSIITSTPLEPDRLKDFLDSIAEKTFRIKGFVPSASGTMVHVDCTGKRVIQKSIDKAESQQQGLVLLFPGNSEYPEKLKDIWIKKTGTDALVKY